ncbi:MAG: SUMF1/EgtB/PvdO family nonheme iron enzyme [Deltaproteobacteria bacterium]|jgi:formylglycine-generating enzyme required for sulfatase activity|nr:SUMF1/EgtB/PvdO family nonheme iron enzyme [Deltaproteobacteria bacterium]
MPDKKLVDIISDAPEVKSVKFGFEHYARTIAELIANKKNKTPLVIGIYGPWGSGKTTLMETVKSYLESDVYEAREIYRKCKTVWFQAWKYDKEDEILAALIEEILRAIKKDKSSADRIKGELEEVMNRTGIPKGFAKLANRIIGKVASYAPMIKGGLEEVKNKVDIPKGVAKLAEKFIGLDVSDFISEPAYKAKLGFYDTFQEFFDRLLWTYTNLRPNFSSPKTETPDDQKGALVIFIDDLDRCPGPRIVKVLETIKLFMDKKGCVFVIGAANEIIEEALKVRYRDQNARKFMDKIVQVTFNLPQVSDDDFETYMEGMDAIDLYSREKIRPYLPHILPTTKNNPRRFKRFLNDLYLMEGIHRNKHTGIAYNSLLFWKIVEFEAPELVREANENPEVLNILRDIVMKISEEDKATGRWEIAADKIKEVPQRSLHPYLENPKLTGLIRNMDVTAKQVRQLISLGSIAKSAQTVEDEEKRLRDHEFESRAKHKLDEMVKVPAGEFKYGDDKTTVTIDKPFEIDIYPVTNAQFKAFIADNGYGNDDYWKDGGKEWRERQNITEPRYWNDEKWNQPKHPVVGVSYFESKAFATWAKKSLPTEEQWERAARGTDGRKYPWGDHEDRTRSNNKKSGFRKTTRVTLYPDGISPAGCYDMAGNVWEWTESDFDQHQKLKTLRGGSCCYSLFKARCANRGKNSPISRDNDVGFRCIRT